MLCSHSADTSTCNESGERMRWHLHRQRTQRQPLQPQPRPLHFQPSLLLAMLMAEQVCEQASLRGRLCRMRKALRRRLLSHRRRAAAPAFCLLLAPAAQRLAQALAAQHLAAVLLPHQLPCLLLLLQVLAAVRPPTLSTACMMTSPRRICPQAPVPVPAPRRDAAASCRRAAAAAASVEMQ